MHYNNSEIKKDNKTKIDNLINIKKYIKTHKKHMEKYGLDLIDGLDEYKEGRIIR